MEKNTIIAVALGVLVLISIVQAIQITNIKDRVTGDVVKEDSGGVGETYEEMMARMHPEQASPSIGSPSVGSSPTMVGGC